MAGFAVVGVLGQGNLQTQLDAANADIDNLNSELGDLQLAHDEQVALKDQCLLDLGSQQATGLATAQQTADHVRAILAISDDVNFESCLGNPVCNLDF